MCLTRRKEDAPQDGRVDLSAAYRIHHPEGSTPACDAPSRTLRRLPTLPGPTGINVAAHAHSWSVASRLRLRPLGVPLVAPPSTTATRGRRHNRRSRRYVEQ